MKTNECIYEVRWSLDNNEKRYHLGQIKRVIRLTISHFPVKKLHFPEFETKEIALKHVLQFHAFLLFLAFLLRNASV